MNWIVTGAGAISSVGDTAPATFAGLCAGSSGRRRLAGFTAERFRTRYAYEIDDRTVPGADVPMRASRWLAQVIREAADEARLGTDLSAVPVIVGTGLRELRSFELWLRGGVEVGMDDLHFGTALRRRFGTQRSYTICNACSASLYALALGTDLLALDEADTVIVAGADSITQSMFGLLDRVSAQPPDEVRPFDRGRKGVVMGEGAAAVVLRREADVPSGAGIGRVRSVAVNCDAYHVTAPDPRGIAAAIREAHDRAAVTPDDIDLVMLHGTGTVLNDDGEARAMADVFGTHVGTPVVTAIKSMTGHTSGGSGLLALVVALAAMRSGTVPTTLNLTDRIEQAAGFRFAGIDGEKPSRLSLAQVNAFGFGGVNAVAIVEGMGR